jgi:Flp pilus assembly protein TadD
MDEAGALYERALGATKRPSLRLIVALGSFYQRTGKEDDARRLFTDFLEDSGNSVIAGAALADLDAGKDLPRLVASATDGMAEALFNVASALYQENVTQTALVYGRLALYLKPDFPPNQLLVANILEVNRRREEAIAEYRRIEKDSPLSWNARLAVARNLDDLDRADQAVELLEAMAGERPKRTDALIALGDLHRAQEKYGQAVDAYDRAFARIENEAERNWGLFYARGIALERSKQWGRAEADFLRALELQPNQPYVLNYLGYSWVEQGINLDKAKKMLETATKLRRDDGYIIDSLGWALYRTGEYPDAVRHLERAVELRPHDTTINDHLGDAYWRVGRTHEARFQWRRALSLDPAPERVPEIEGKIERGLGAAETVGQGQ